MIDSILQLINPENTITANRALAHAIGMTETIIYSALISKYTYYDSRDMLMDGKWFYCTMVDLQESTTFSWKVQKKAIDNLVKEGLLEIKLSGVPARRYFAIKDDIERLRDLLEAGIQKSRDLSVERSDKSQNRNSRDEDEVLSKSEDESDALKIARFVQRENLDSPGEKDKEELDVETRLAQRENLGYPDREINSKTIEIVRFAQREKLDSPDGINKIRPKTETSFDQTGNKSKDNKTKDDESKSDQSIYPEKEDADYSPKYTKGMVDCLLDGGTVEEAVEASILFGYDELSLNSEIIRNRIRIAENIKLKWFIDDLMRQKSVNRGKVEMIRAIYDLICDVVCNRQSIRINGSIYEWEIVRGQFFKLGYEQVRNVIDRMFDDSLEIKNMRSYLLSSLYNASLTETIYLSSKPARKPDKRLVKQQNILVNQ